MGWGWDQTDLKCTLVVTLVTGTLITIDVNTVGSSIPIINLKEGSTRSYIVRVGS